MKDIIGIFIAPIAIVLIAIAYTCAQIWYFTVEVWK